MMARARSHFRCLRAWAGEAQQFSPASSPRGHSQIRSFDHNSTVAIGSIALISGEKSSTNDTSEGATSPSDRWYPTLRVALELLSQAYACLPRAVFEGISQVLLQLFCPPRSEAPLQLDIRHCSNLSADASNSCMFLVNAAKEAEPNIPSGPCLQEVLEACTSSLLSAASRHTVRLGSPRESRLLLVSQLLILREQIAPFDSTFVVTTKVNGRGGGGHSAGVRLTLYLSIAISSERVALA